MKYPKGYHPRKGITKVAVSYPDEQFKSIIARAKREKKDFSAMVCELCAVGERDLHDSDMFEPTIRKEE